MSMILNDIMLFDCDNLFNNDQQMVDDDRYSTKLYNHKYVNDTNDNFCSFLSDACENMRECLSPLLLQELMTTDDLLKINEDGITNSMDVAFLENENLESGVDIHDDSYSLVRNDLMWSCFSSSTSSDQSNGYSPVSNFSSSCSENDSSNSLAELLEMNDDIFEKEIGSCSNSNEIYKLAKSKNLKRPSENSFDNFNRGCKRSRHKSPVRTTNLKNSVLMNLLVGGCDLNAGYICMPTSNNRNNNSNKTNNRIRNNNRYSNKKNYRINKIRSNYRKFGGK